MSTVIINPSEILAQLSTDEKAALLSGDDLWHTVPIPRLGLPRVRVSDGPNGVRGTLWLGGAAASCFPAATGLGASFDIHLVAKVGEALGEECRARGVHCLLGPTTNIQRSPLGGRGFESYGEDPFLSGTLAKAWLEGVQSRKVMTTPKHYVGNEQEYNRRANNSVIDERTLHEIYLEPFRIQCKAKPSGFMSSYQRVNGVHASESPYLLGKVLRGDFGFKGLIMSDWVGTYSSAEAVKAGLDLEMPGPASMRGILLERAVTCGKVSVADIDDCALRVLNFIKEAQESGIPFEAEEKSIDTPKIRELLLESALGGVVLLKNTAAILPLKSISGLKIAVIGPNVKEAFISGGGSASLRSTYAISPLDAITKEAEKQGGQVAYAVGADTHRWTPLLDTYLQIPGTNEQGMQIEWYSEDPHVGTKVVPIFAKTNDSSYAYFIENIPAHVPIRSWVIIRSTFTPDIDGVWEFGLGVAGQADLYINDELVVENSVNQTPSILFFLTGAEERVGQLAVKAGQQYNLEIRFSNFKQISPTSPYAGRRGGIRFGGQRKYDAATLIEEAVATTKASDVTILVVGTTAEWESESYDRKDMKLPKGSDALVQAVLAANPNAIIVNQSGMPVEFPWLKKATTLLQAFYGGNECGSAISNVIFGKHNPSGKLPLTFPKVLEDSPSYGAFGHEVDTVYTEGIKVGYRYFDRPGNKASAFPFGFGLSYSTFAFADLKIKKLPLYGVAATFTIFNTGSVEGGEVGQVYVHAKSRQVERPDIELKGFQKVFLGPGESKEITVKMDHSALSYYDVGTKTWVGEKGEYEIRVGPSSAQASLIAPFVLEESFSWVGLKEPTPVELFY